MRCPHLSAWFQPKQPTWILLKLYKRERSRRNKRWSVYHSLIIIKTLFPCPFQVCVSLQTEREGYHESFKSRKASYLEAITTKPTEQSVCYRRRQSSAQDPLHSFFLPSFFVFFDFRFSTVLNLRIFFFY